MDMQVMYVVRYETEARRQEERAAEARKAWLARERELVAAARVAQNRPQPAKAVLKRLATALATALS